MRQRLTTASVSVDSIVGDKTFRGYGKYCEGHGWDIDVLEDGILVAMRNAAYAERDGGVDIVKETINAVSEGRAIGNTYFV